MFFYVDFPAFNLCYPKTGRQWDSHLEISRFTLTFLEFGLSIRLLFSLVTDM